MPLGAWCKPPYRYDNDVLEKIPQAKQQDRHVWHARDVRLRGCGLNPGLRHLPGSSHSAAPARPKHVSNMARLRGMWKSLVTTPSRLQGP